MRGVWDPDPEVAWALRGAPSADTAVDGEDTPDVPPADGALSSTLRWRRTSRRVSPSGEHR